MPSEGARGSQPARELVATSRFGRLKKRFHAQAREAIDKAVRGILDDPLLGEQKRGALSTVRVVKFKVGPQLLLLAYHFDDAHNRVELIDIGSHENFYRDLQRYLAM
ncbi:MAG: type II toxin-antitoxin system RelE/ParE family toxin [Chloroflexi bacterium]|nr:type II toxin-antitoxin system RelE/ParE family toxin [Chloroflexota bacterium]